MEYNLHKNHVYKDIIEDTIKTAKEKVVELLDEKEISYGNHVYISYETTSFVHNILDDKDVDLRCVRLGSKSAIEYIVDAVIHELRDISRCKN